MMHHSQSHHQHHHVLHEPQMDFHRYSVDHHHHHQQRIHHHHQPLQQHHQHQARPCNCKLCWSYSNSNSNNSNAFSTPGRSISPLPEHMKADCSCSHHHHIIPNPNPNPNPNVRAGGFYHGVDSRSPSFSVTGPAASADCFVSPRHHSEHSFYHLADHNYVPRTPNSNEFGAGINLQREPKLFSPVIFDKSRGNLQETSMMTSVLAGPNDCFAPANQVTLYNWYLIRCSTSSEVAVGGFLNPGTVRTERLETTYIAQRLHKCHLLTKDGVEIHLMGLIDDCTTVQNGFPIEIVHSFLSGFPYTWNHLLSNEFRAYSSRNSGCPADVSHSLYTGESSQPGFEEHSKQDINVTTSSRKVPEVTPAKRIDALAVGRTDNLGTSEADNENVVPEGIGGQPSSDDLHNLEPDNVLNAQSVDVNVTVDNLIKDKENVSLPSQERSAAKTQSSKIYLELDEADKGSHDEQNEQVEKLSHDEQSEQVEKLINGKQNEQVMEVQSVTVSDVAPAEKPNCLDSGDTMKPTRKLRVSARVTRSMQRLGKHLDFEKEQSSVEGETLSCGDVISPQTHFSRRADGLQSSRSIRRSAKKDTKGSASVEIPVDVDLFSNVQVKDVAAEVANNIMDQYLSVHIDKKGTSVDSIKVEQPGIQSLLYNDTEKKRVASTKLTPLFENEDEPSNCLDGDVIKEVPADVDPNEDDSNSKIPEVLIKTEEVPAAVALKDDCFSTEHVEALVKMEEVPAAVASNDDDSSINGLIKMEEVPAAVASKGHDSSMEGLIKMEEAPEAAVSKSENSSSTQVFESSVATDLFINDMEVSTNVEQVDSGELDSVVEHAEEHIHSLVKVQNKHSPKTSLMSPKEARETGKVKAARRRSSDVGTPDSDRKRKNGVDDGREGKEESVILKSSSKLPPPLPRPRVLVSKELVSEAFGLKTSRSGRILVPPLAHWCGQSLMRDKDGGIIAISDGSKDGSSAGGGDYKFKPPAEAELKKLQKRLREAAIECTPKKKSRKP